MGVGAWSLLLSTSYGAPLGWGYKETLAHVHGLFCSFFFYDMECVCSVSECGWACDGVVIVWLTWARICRIGSVSVGCLCMLEPFHS
ncbi:hypothetical protein J3F84DRAFT_373594 [Trichoderma pleuroticola]